jgi:hypothetical protein
VCKVRGEGLEGQYRGCWRRALRQVRAAEVGHEGARCENSAPDGLAVLPDAVHGLCGVVRGAGGGDERGRADEVRAPPLHRALEKGTSARLANDAVIVVVVIVVIVVVVVARQPRGTIGAMFRALRGSVYCGAGVRKKGVGTGDEILAAIQEDFDVDFSEDDEVDFGM